MMEINGYQRSLLAAIELQLKYVILANNLSDCTQVYKHKADAASELVDIIRNMMIENK